MKDRYKDMEFGEYIDGEFVAYEDMTDEQLMDIQEQDVDRNRREYQEEWYEHYIDTQE